MDAGAWGIATNRTCSRWWLQTTTEAIKEKVSPKRAPSRIKV